MAIEITVRELFDLFRSGSDMEKDQIDTVFLQGWIRTCRQEDGFVIAEISDGTCLGFAEVRMPAGSACPAAGAAVSVVGRYCETGKDGRFFVDASEVTCEAKGRPEQFAGDREISRRRIRSSLFMAVHEFFQSQGFMLYDSLLENAGILTMNFRDVYAVLPEDGRWYLQTAMAFADEDDGMDLLEDLAKFCVSYVLENCQTEMQCLNRNGRMRRLRQLLETVIERKQTVESAGDQPLLTWQKQVNGARFALQLEGRAFAGTCISPEAGEYAYTLITLSLDDLLACLYDA
ncbi:MAG: hypothetical protein IJI33_02060 [Solobacterium sp.]|nr:hypothetical protein [Solobacterium sp.]MBQ6531759.1 hypothetical protein [Solobacterium sp.]